MMDIDGATVVITGASGGLGSSTARHLSSLGARVVVSGRDEITLRALASEIDGEALVEDLTGPVPALLDAVDRADVLVLCAGVEGGSTVAGETVEHVDAVIDVNLRSPIQIAIRFAQSRMAAGRGGQIVLIGSVAGLAATPLYRLYNATKFGLRGFGLALRQDLAPDGIGVTVITPGYIRDAGMFAESGVKLPRWVRTRSTADLASSVARAIERNPTEIFVASAELRLAALVSTVAPRLAALGHRWVGIDKTDAVQAAQDERALTREP
jgi:short-subunit dehydrogenase